MNSIQFLNNVPLYIKYIDTSIPEFIYLLNDLELSIFFQLVTLSEQA